MEGMDFTFLVYTLLNEIQFLPQFLYYPIPELSWFVVLF